MKEHFIFSHTSEQISGYELNLSVLKMSSVDYTTRQVYTLHPAEGFIIYKRKPNGLYYFEISFKYWQQRPEVTVTSFISFSHKKDLEAGSLEFVWQLYNVIDNPGSFCLSPNLYIWLPLLMWFLSLCWLLGSSQYSTIQGSRRKDRSKRGPNSHLSPPSEVFLDVLYKAFSFKRSHIVFFSAQPVKTGISDQRRKSGAWTWPRKQRH